MWSDSAFPAGGAAHSCGLEGALQNGYIRSMPDLHEWISDFVEQVFGPSDLSALILAYRATQRGDGSALFRVDERLGALKITREEREASVAQGQSRLQVSAKTLDDPRLAQALDDALEGRWDGHAASVWGLVGAVGELGEAETARSFTYTVIAGMTSAAIRMRLTGQQGAQNIMISLADKVEAAIKNAESIDCSDSLASLGPRLELAQMHHESARVRLFMS